MYEIYGINHFGTVEYHKYAMDKEYADFLFRTLTKCVDCKMCHILNAETGEVLALWHFNGENI